MINQFLDQLNEKHTATQIVNDLLPVIEGERYGILPTMVTKLDDYLDNMHVPPDALEDF